MNFIMNAWNQIQWKHWLILYWYGEIFYYIRSECFYKDIKAEIQEKFNTSDYKKDNPYNFTAVNKKVIVMMKYELSGTIMSKFVCLRSRVYTYLKEDDNETKVKKKLKGIKTNIIKDKITLQNYKEV